MFLLGAYVDGKLTGIVQYLFHRSTWTPGNYCYLQYPFVKLFKVPDRGSVNPTPLGGLGQRHFAA